MARLLRCAKGYIERLDRDHVAAVFAYANYGKNPQAARSLTIGADRGVIVAAIQTSGALCALNGAILCEVPELASGQTAQVRVVLGIGATEPSDVLFESIDAVGVIERGRLTVMPLNGMGVR